MLIGEQQRFALGTVATHYRNPAYIRGFQARASQNQERAYSGNSLISGLDQEIDQDIARAVPELEKFPKERARAIVNGDSPSADEEKKITAIGMALVGNRGYRQDILFGAGVAALRAALNPDIQSLETMFDPRGI